jgi:hypothetical protein
MPASNINVGKKRQQGKVAHATTRVGMLCPYIGPALPPWFDSFAYSAAASAELFDWIVIVLDDIPTRELPPNIKMIHISRDDFARRVATLDVDGRGSGSEEVLESIGVLIKDKAWATVEFKPALGFLFEDLLNEHGYVFCSMFFLLFLFIMVSLSLLSIYCCLFALSDMT